jgi:hypothetical protein
LIHHFLELHERDVPVSVLISLANDLLPDVLVSELLAASSQHLFDLFGGYLAVTVLVEVLEGLGKSVFLEYLFFIDAGYLPLAKVNATIAV